MIIMSMIIGALYSARHQVGWDAARIFFLTPRGSFFGAHLRGLTSTNNKTQKSSFRSAITKCARDPGQIPTMLTIAMLHDACRNALNCSAGQYKMPHVGSTERCPVLASSGNGQTTNDFAPGDESSC